MVSEQDIANEFNGPLIFIPRTRQKGRQEAGHDVSTTSYPLMPIHPR